MSTFIDTSGFYPLLVGTDARHREVLRAFERVAKRGHALWTTSYILLETTALLQHRVGLGAVRDLWDSLVPLCEVEWVSAALHRRGMDRLLRTDRRRVSLVDCISFECMSERGVSDALALDTHFAEYGFRLLVKANATASR